MIVLVKTPPCWSFGFPCKVMRFNTTAMIGAIQEALAHCIPKLGFGFA